MWVFSVDSFFEKKMFPPLVVVSGHSKQLSDDGRNEADENLNKF